MDRPSSHELDAIISAAEALRDMEAQVAEAKRRLAFKVEALRDIPDPSDLLRVAAYAYWHVPEANANQLALLAVGKPSAAAMLKRAGAVSVGVSCDRCGKDLPITSRTMMAEVLNRVDNGKRRWAEGYCFLCRLCQEALHEQRSEEHDRLEHEKAVRRQVLSRMNYAEYLATPEWKARREGVMYTMLYNRGKLTCEICPELEGLSFVHSQFDLLNGCEVVNLLCATRSGALAEAGKLAQRPLPSNRAPRIELDLREREFRTERGIDRGDEH